MSSSDNNLKEAALTSMQFAYAPYSLKKIGASVLLTNGQVYSGCNIENASYGGTVCAERVAIWKAFSENKSNEKITEIVVASNEDLPWPPCGFCRQILAEFALPNTKIILINLNKIEKVYTLNELFPHAFKPEHLINPGL